jgi:hypothetical protein
MSQEFEYDCLPAWCEECDEQGFYFVEDAEALYWVVHQTCGHEILSPDKKPKMWECSGCQKSRNVPEGLYEQSVDLHLESDLPSDVREHLSENDEPVPTIARFFWYLVSYLCS